MPNSCSRYKIIFCLFFLFSVSKKTNAQIVNGFSNKGTDFWVGYAPTEKMYVDDIQDIYFTFYNNNNVSTNITISIPNTGFTSLTYSVAANSLFTTPANIIPETGANDARIKYEGKSKKGIHITSTLPVSAYSHSFTRKVYGATLLFPTQTLGREYKSLNFTQRANFDSARSFVFIVATDDSTIVEITPSVNTEKHLANTTFKDTLKKGEVLNIFGASTGQSGSLYTAGDLTGTKIKSVSYGIAQCKPIAVFCGSSKITIDCGSGSGSLTADNLIQQMFPKNAWGKKYITAPLRTNPTNLYRIMVQDASTTVKVNGTALLTSTLINNNYYEFKVNAVNVIEGDKPIMVAQYLSTSNQCGNSNSKGDPDMIFLSSVEQTIDTVATLSAQLPAAGSQPASAVDEHYINVVLKTVDTANFTIDGTQVANQFIIVPSDNNYAYARLSVNAGTHLLICKGGFNAAAYGVGDAESYGYNAGTNIKDLYYGSYIQNQYSTGPSAAACVGTPFTFTVNIPFAATAMTWNFNNNSLMTPNNSVFINNPIPTGTVLVNGVTLYTYSLPSSYVFSNTGNFPYSIEATNPNPDGCKATEVFTFNVNVVQAVIPNFSFITNGCIGAINFKDSSNSISGFVNRWQWNFGDAASGTLDTSSLKNPTHNYAIGGNYTIKVRAITNEGCYADIPKNISLSTVPNVNFTVSKPICTGVPVTLKDSSNIVFGTITKWDWNFGDPASGTSNTAVTANTTHTYTTANNYTINYQVTSSTGCQSPILPKLITVTNLPTVNFTFTTNGCFATPVSFAASPNGLAQYNWSFNDPSSGLNDTSSIQNTTHQFTNVGDFDVKLIASNAGCSSTIKKTVSLSAIPSASFTVPNPKCVGIPVNFNNSSTITSGNITQWNWIFGDPVSGTNDTSSIKNPSHTYNSSGSYKVDLLATSRTGCKSSVTSNTFNVDFAPTVDFVITSNGCSNSPVSFAANPVGLAQYNWNYGDINSGVNNTATGVISTHNFTSGGNFSITLNTLTNSGCNSSKNKTLSLIAPLNAVTVSANNITANSVTFNWNAVAGATGYQVSVNGGSYITPSSGGNGLSHLVNGLTTGQTVTISVKAIGTVDCANSTGNASAKTISPIVSIYIPNTFTPNEDGINDVLLVYGNNITAIEMLIFNQWGNKIFEIRNQSQGWDGKHNGKDQPVGVYIYAAKITTTNGEIITKKGSINLIR